MLASTTPLIGGSDQFIVKQQGQLVRSSHTNMWDLLQNYLMRVRLWGTCVALMQAVKFETEISDFSQNP